MKVALVAEWLDSWRGGAETSTLQFLHHLMGTDIELHVFTRSRPASTPRMLVHTVSGAAMSRTRRSMTFARRVEKMIQAESIDLVHAISPCRCADIYQPRGGTVAETIERNLALRRNGAVRTLKRYANQFNVKQRYLLKMERELVGCRDRPGRSRSRLRSEPHPQAPSRGPIVVAISKYVVDQLKRHYGLPDDRIRLIYNGVDPDSSTPPERQRNRKTVREEFQIAPKECLLIQVAHNFRLKGVRRWMEALTLLVKSGVRDVRSLVIGKGNSAVWRRLSAKLGLTDYLTFVGPSGRVSEFHHAADCLVHPTYYDPCSRVVLEAMAAGLPCITTRWDGAAEMIEPGKNGFVLDDPGNVAGLAELVLRLRDPELRASIGQRATQVTERASMDRHTREMVRLYEELLSKGAKA